MAEVAAFPAVLLGFGPFDNPFNENGGLVLATAFNAPQSLMSLSVTIDFGTGTTGDARVAVYDDDPATGPRNVLVESVAAQAIVDGRNVFPLPAAIIPAGVIWIAWQQSANNLANFGAQGTCKRVYKNQAFGPFPSPMGAPDGAADGPHSLFGLFGVAP